MRTRPFVKHLRVARRWGRCLTPNLFALLHQVWRGVVEVQIHLVVI